MKKLLILLAFLPMLAWGQWSRNLYFNGTTRIITTDTVYSSPIDTIPVIMLVCDTASHYAGDLVMYSSEFSRLRNEQPVLWIRGYEVTKFDSLRFKWHVAYLDENKQPVKYLVWMSKEVGK